MPKDWSKFVDEAYGGSKDKEASGKTDWSAVYDEEVKAASKDTPAFEQLEMVGQGAQQALTGEDRIDVLSSQIFESQAEKERVDAEKAQDYTLGDIGRQLAQGPALGGIHNVEGVVGGVAEAAKEAFSSPEAPFNLMGEERGSGITSAFGEGFSEAREEGIARNELARNRLGPELATGLEIVGSLVGSPATSIGRGAMKTIGKFATSVGREAAEEITKKVGPKAASSIMKRALNDMKVGAATGAIASEEEDISGILKDTAITGAFGGALNISGRTANALKKSLQSTKQVQKLQEYGVDATKWMDKKYRAGKESVAGFLEKMTQVPKEEIIRYAKAPYKQTKLIREKYGIENEKEFANVFAETMTGRLEEERRKTANRMSEIATEHFGDREIPDTIRNGFVSRMKDLREGLSDLAPDRAKRETLTEWISALETKKPKAIMKGGEVVGYKNPRQPRMRDIITMFEDAKNKMDFKSQLGGEPSKKGKSYQQMLKDLTYGEGGSIRDMMRETAPNIDKVFSKYVELHDVFDGMNKNLLKRGKGLTALKSATKKGDVSQTFVEKADKVTKGALKEGDRTAEQMAEDFQVFRYFDDPDLAAFSTGRSLFAPVVGAGLGQVFGKTGRDAGFAMGTALSSPRLLKYGLDARKGVRSASGALANRLGENAVGPTMEAAMARALEEGLGQ